MMKKPLFNFLKKRGYIFQSTNEKTLSELLDKNTSFYIGFDPTANSLHIGHLVQLMFGVWLLKNNHQVYFLFGGGTGFIGDPSERMSQRKMMDINTIHSNAKALQTQVENLFNKFDLDKKPIFVNNYDWLKQIDIFQFFQQVASCFSVNRLLSVETFKNRLENNISLSFLEFSYILFQSYDFYHLYKNNGVRVQVGGSDQWNNIVHGIELIHKKLQGEAYGITLNLLKKSDGEKMGKSASGTVWLDINKTSSYDFYQFWLNIHDDDVINCFKLLTTFSDEEIEKYSAYKGKAIKEVKQILAFELTKIVHNLSEANKAVEITKTNFANEGNNFIEKIIDKSSLNNDYSIINFLVLCGFVKSKSEARRVINEKGVFINNCLVEDISKTINDYLSNLDEGFVLKKGKKHILKIRIN